MTAKRRAHERGMAVLNVEIPIEMKFRLEAYANDLGLPQASAVRVLLGSALNTAGYRTTVKEEQ